MPRGSQADTVSVMSLSRVARIADVVIVAVLVVSAQIQLWSESVSGLEGGTAVHSILAALITVPLFLRRRQPLLVVAAIALGSWLQFELGGGLFQPWFAGVLALYSVAAHGRFMHAVIGGGFVAASVFAVDIPKLAQGDPVDEVLPAWFALMGVWGFGRWMRHRRLEAIRLHEHAEFLERNRDEMALAAVAEERSRIARELHDLVAHSMSVIVLQAQGAERILERDPSAARKALSSIETSGRQGLEELRRLLGILRSTGEQAPLDPQPGLRHLDSFIEQVREAGLRVDLVLEGDWSHLPPGVDLSAYRIVQEALTNVLKHAGPAQATVTVRCLPGDVEIEVVDDGTGSGAEPGSQLGLIGMRERVAVYGGKLEAGKRPEGGFLIRARLPTVSVNHR